MPYAHASGVETGNNEVIVTERGRYLAITSDSALTLVCRLARSRRDGLSGFRLFSSSRYCREKNVAHSVTGFWRVREVGGGLQKPKACVLMVFVSVFSLGRG